MPRRREPGRVRRQHGIITLLILLVVTSAGAYFLLRALNRAQGPVAAAGTTQRALADAREALLGYAARYPDNAGVPLHAGPGRLPCPDTRLDTGEPAGAADAPCAASSGTETGRLPWHTLDVPELRDGSGAPLWYAVAEPFRAHLGTALNSDTAGTLDVATCAGGDDLVALVLAPGAALADQGARGPASFDAAAYLEGDNRTRGDGCFSALHDADHNDEILALSRRDLLAAIETRVLADVANALQRYYQAHGAYPWLSPFAPPATSPYQGAVGTRQGALPLRRSDPGNDPAAIVGSDFAFPAPFLLRWSVPIAGTVTRTGTLPPSEACVRASGSATCDSGTALAGVVALGGDVSGSAGSGWSAGLCKATQGQRVSCRAERLVTEASRALRRTYTVVMTHWPYEIEAPSASAPRFQHFRRFNQVLASAPPPETLELVLQDVRIETDGTETPLGEARLALSAGDTVEAFELTGVTFDLEVDDDDAIDVVDPLVDPTPDTLAVTRRSPGELPHWLITNGWQALLHVAYAAAHAPGDPAVSCTGHVAGCLNVDWQRTGAVTTTRTDVAGLVLAAGPALSGAALTQVRPGTALDAYFEGANAAGGALFERREASATFNDRVQLLDPDE